MKEGTQWESMVKTDIVSDFATHFASRLALNSSHRPGKELLSDAQVITAVISAVEAFQLTLSTTDTDWSASAALSLATYKKALPLELGRRVAETWDDPNFDLDEDAFEDPEWKGEPQPRLVYATSHPEEDLICDLEADLNLREEDYETGTAILERLLIRLQNSALGRKFSISGEVDSAEYCRVFDGFISCNIEVLLRPGQLIDVTLAIRPSATGWTVRRYQLDDDDEVEIVYEEELVSLAHDLLSRVSKQTTAQFAGEE